MWVDGADQSDLRLEFLAATLFLLGVAQCSSHLDGASLQRADGTAGVLLEVHFERRGDGGGGGELGAGRWALRGRNDHDVIVGFVGGVFPYRRAEPLVGR